MRRYTNPRLHCAGFPEVATVSPTVRIMQTTNSGIEIHLMSTMDSAYCRAGMCLVFRVEV